ncbi:nuclear transport factor 2 family protein [Pseudaquidulcibacter saccharophilus]|uniref:nuclear transport factor 2 family protein n=1 Tax=Pseudaquidulcibacter saccharophilus TaxID=2831900 RepID=UPI001EFF031C|nr:nuclear transport factor 2 family protein [Pseudaquidulcibacter saccharophilus]
MVKKMRPRKTLHIKNIALMAVAPLFCASITFCTSVAAQVPDWGPAKPVVKTPAQTTKPANAKAPVTKPTVTKVVPTKVVATKTPTKNNITPTFKAPEVNQPSSQTVFKAPTKTVVTNVTAEDQSQELVAVDLHLASDISDYGPLAAYAKHLSKAGVLYDADGGTPEGVSSAEARFKDFPTAITLVRVPEKAMASANGGSSWGAYKIYRGTQLLSSGRYLAVWRKEQGVWKIVSELAAGKDMPAPVLPAKPSSAQATGAKENPALSAKKLKDAFGRTVN